MAGTKNAEREAARRPTPYGSTRSSWPTPREHVRGVSELSLDNSDSAGNAVGLMEEGFSATGGESFNG